MAGQSVIGALRVVIGADSATLEKDLKKAWKTLDGFGANIAKVGLAMGTVAAGAALALGVSIKKAIDEADKLGKMSQSFGIPVEQLSALKHAADLSGISIEDVGKSVGRLSRSMSEIAGGKATGGAADAFNALRINVKNADGTLKSSTQVMDEVADKFAGMQDGAAKTALAISIFGRAGANMIPMLNQGAAGLKEARDEAEALGLVIDGRTSKAAELFNDNLTRLQRVLTGITIKVAAELAPALALLTSQFVQAAKDGSVVRTVADSIMSGFEGIVIAAKTVPLVFIGIARTAVELGNVIAAALSLRMVEAVQAINRLNKAGAEIDQQFAENRRGFQDFNEQARMLADHFGNVGTQAGKAAGGVLASKNALDEFFKSQQKSIASQRAEAQTVGLLAGSKESLRLVLQAEAIAQENNIRLTTLQRERLSALAGEARNAAMTLAGATMTEEAMLPWQKYEQQLRNINDLLMAQKISAETAGRASQQAAEAAGATWQQVTSGAAGGFASLANEMGKSSAKMATVGKALGIVEATINTYVAFTKALASIPPPLNYVAAAGVLAAGMAKVMAIKSQNVPKMAMGGSFTVPGGVSGADNKFVKLNLASGERVDVTPANQAQGGGSARGMMMAPVNLVGKWFDRETVIKLMDDMRLLAPDGYTLIPVQR